MRCLYILLRQELRMQMLSMATYIAGAMFLLLMGVIYMRLLHEYSVAEQSQGMIISFFASFWLPALFMAPLLTMRSIAEERRMGTLETLRTTPVSTFQIIFSKFIASWLLYCLLWLTSILFPLIVLYVNGTGSIGAHLLDVSSLFGSYCFVALSGMLFIAVGILSSSLTRTQLVAGMLCFGSLFFIIWGPKLVLTQESIAPLGWFDPLLMHLQLFEHLEDFSSGIIDTRPIIFYLTNTFLALGVSVLVVDHRS